MTDYELQSQSQYQTDLSFILLKEFKNDVLSFFFLKKKPQTCMGLFLKPNAQTYPHKSKHLASFYIAFFIFFNKIHYK